MEFNPEIYNSTPEVLIFRFRDGVEYRKFAEYAHEQGGHIFVCNNQKLTVATDAFTREEAFRIAEVALGLSTISTASLTSNINKIWWWRMEN